MIDQEVRMFSEQQLEVASWWETAATPERSHHTGAPELRTSQVSFSYWSPS